MKIFCRRRTSIFSSAYFCCRLLIAVVLGARSAWCWPVSLLLLNIALSTTTITNTVRGPPCFVRQWQQSSSLFFQQQQHRNLPHFSQHGRLKRTRTSLHISNIFGGGGSDNNKQKTLPTLPRNVKDAVAKCRIATQDALQKRISRMDIEFPVGAKFNVEATTTSSTKKKQRGGGSGESGPSKADLDRSNRELARLFVDMFQPVGSDHITVVFGNTGQADEAKSQWKEGDMKLCFITSIDRRQHDGGGTKKNKKKKEKSKGFAAKLAAEVGDNDNNDDNDDDDAASGPFKLPENTEVALFVAPGPKELLQVEKICQQVGMGTLVILLNARLSTISNFGKPSATKLFTDGIFESVFHLGAAPQDVAPNCLLYRSYPGDWVLARKPSVVGQPKTILSQAQKPTAEQCRLAFESMELSDVERGVETVLQNAAEWFS